MAGITNNNINVIIKVYFILLEPSTLPLADTRTLLRFVCLQRMVLYFCTSHQQNTVDGLVKGFLFRQMLQCSQQ